MEFIINETPLVNLLFIFFTSLIIINATFVVTLSNPIFSVFFLIFCFFNVSGFIFLLGVEFIALTYILIYVGAIAVLFLFIVMMLNIKEIQYVNKIHYKVSINFLLGIFFYFSLFSSLFINKTFIHEVITKYSLPKLKYINWLELVNQLSQLEKIGHLIFTYYFIYIILISLLLFIAIIGAIILTIQHSPNIKRQFVYSQNSRKYKNTLINLTIN